MSKILNTTELITSIKKRASIPTNQKLFSEADFIEILNEEMNTYAIPYLMEQHEEYLVNFVDLPLVNGKSHYNIPYRAVGNKIREVVYRDKNGNFAEISRISMEDLEDFQSLSNVANNGIFYIENNHIVIMQNTTSTGFLRVYYYLQPNSLVPVINGETLSGVFNPTLKLSTRTNQSTGSAPITTNPSFNTITNSFVNSTYKWTASGGGADEYYLELAAGGDPGITQPTHLELNGITKATSVIGTMAIGTWNYGDNDGLLYSTIYVKLIDSTNPDTKTVDYVSTGDVNTITDEITIASHGIGTGAKLQLTGSNLPTGLVADIDYWAIRTGNDKFKMATSFANAAFGSPIDITVMSGYSSATMGMISGVLTTDTTFPTTFTATSKYDIISNNSPNNIQSFDIIPIDFDPANKIITFAVEDIDISVEIDNYLYLAEKTPVPQLPVELHPLLTQAATVYCLEAMGDIENLNMAQRKLGIMEKNLRGILNNRTEGSPKKITNRNGILYDSVRTSRRGV